MFWYLKKINNLKKKTDTLNYMYQHRPFLLNKFQIRNYFARFYHQRLNTDIFGIIQVSSRRFFLVIFIYKE